MNVSNRPIRFTNLALTLSLLLALSLQPGLPAAAGEPTTPPVEETTGRWEGANRWTSEENDVHWIESSVAAPPSPGRAPLLPPGGILDPPLEPGFPVQTFHTSGSYHAGQAIHTLVGNVDDDPQLEIVVTSLAVGPVYAWNWDGSPLSGWPVGQGHGAGYVAMGDLSNPDPGLEVFSGYWSGPDDLVAYSNAGDPLPGWPRTCANYVTTPPALADVDGDGLDEIFIGEEDNALHAYKADGSVLPGWPRYGFGGQERHTPAIADLDGDGDLEIVTAGSTLSSGLGLFAYHHDGTEVAGFPIVFPNGFPDTFPAIGDVDGDGALEIVVVTKEPAPPWEVLVHVLSDDGAAEWTLATSSDVSYGTAPALADLDGDAIPEIVVQTEESIDVWYGDGTVFPGWPVSWGGGYWLGNSAPVAGDVDGDQLPEIVVTSHLAGSGKTGLVRVYNADGTSHPEFPITLLIGSGAVPAIADLDLDGRNEIIITGNYWNGISGYYDKVWAYDLGGPQHGRVEWEQFGGGPRHRGYYEIQQADLSVTKSGAPDPVAVGEVLTYTLRIANSGPLSATGVVATDTLPPGVTYVSATPSQGTGCTEFGGAITCSLGILADEATATVAILVVPEAAGTFTNTAGVTSGEFEVRTGNNIAIERTRVEVPIAGVAAFNDSPTTLGDLTTLTATVAAGDNVTYTWAFGDGATGSGAVVSHTYPAVGLYTTVVTATNGVSELTATTMVTITDVPVAGLQATNNSPTVLGEPTILSATVTAGSNVTYAWAFGDGTTGSGAVVSHIYPAVGVYATVVTAANSVSELTATTTVTITDVPIAGLAAVNDSPTMLGHPTALTATITAGSNVTYTWALGDGEFGDGMVVSHIYPAVGVYVAVVTASNPVSELTATTTIVVDEAITGLYTANDSPTMLGNLTTLTATITAGSNVTYTWALGDGTFGSGAAVSHTYPTVGTYTAVVTATNSVSELTTTTAVTITDVPIAGLQATNDSPTLLDHPTALTATITAGSNVTYTWALGDGTFESGAAVSHTYPAVGVYAAVVTAANSVSELTATTTAIITDAPVARLQATSDSPTMLGESTMLTATIVAGSNVTYTWALGDGTFGSGAVVSHIYPAVGTYTAVVTAGNSVSELTATTTVTIIDVPVAGLQATNDSPTLLGEPTILSATIVAGSNVTYTWALGDGTMGSGAVVTYTYPSEGIYTAVVIAANSNGEVTATTVITITRSRFFLHLPLVLKQH
jgi:uncharacterized repeat protein (TIGR01451 family)